MEDRALMRRWMRLLRIVDKAGREVLDVGEVLSEAGDMIVVGLVVVRLVVIMIIIRMVKLAAGLLVRMVERLVVKFCGETVSLLCLLVSLTVTSMVSLWLDLSQGSPDTTFRQERILLFGAPLPTTSWHGG